ncbi:MAG TPA: MFS transporter [Actinomycetota bacterium]|nr:MFS transporter [Actinomycetota bacterium]
MPLFGFAGEDARQKVLVLLTMCFALAMAMLDNTVVNIALPTIQRELSATVTDLQWIVDGYVLAFASLLLTGGILGDRYGRKRTFLTGLVTFTVASLACGLAGSGGQLIAARALQGVGAALLMPGTLSILTVTFPPHERSKAIGLWAGVSGLALALGPTLGGWIVEHVGWPAVFFLNVPIGVVAFAIASRTVRESVSEETRHLDLPGLGLGTGGLFFLTYGLIEANQRGWGDGLIVGSLTAAVVLLGAFLAWDRRSPRAMMPLSFFRIPAFSAGNAVAFSVSLSMFSIFLFVALYMQAIRGYTPFEAGLRFLPMTLMIIVTAPNAGHVAQRIGARTPMTYGLTLASLGLFGLTFVGPETPYWLIAALFVLMGHGMGSTMAPMTAAVMGAVGPQRAGLGSAMTNTSREVGGVLGIALLGTVLFDRLGAVLAPRLGDLGLPAGRTAALADAASHGFVAPEALRSLGLSSEQIAGFVAAFRDAYMSGFHLALAIAAAVLATAAVVANRFLPGRAHAAEIHAEAAARGPTSAERQTA